MLISIRKCVLMSFKGAAFLLETQAQGIHVDHPRGASGLGRRKLWSWKPLSRRRGQGSPAGAALMLPLSEQSGEVSLGFCAAASGSGHVSRRQTCQGPGGRRQRRARAVSSVRASSGAQSRRQCPLHRGGARIRTPVYRTNTQTYSRPPCGTAWSEALGFSHQNWPVEPVNILCGRFFVLSKLP